MKKICFFNSYPSWGGGEKFYIDFARGMKDLGYDILAFATAESILSKSYADAGIKQYPIRVNNLSAFNPLKVARLAAILRKEHVDAIIFTTSEDLKLGALAAKFAGIKTIVYRRGLAVPIKNRFTNRFIFKKLVTHILANSQETKNTILQNLRHVINAESIRVIYNGISISADQPAPDKKILNITAPPGSIIIGNAGRLVPQKGQRYLIDIAIALQEKGIEFVIAIAGDGPLKSELKELIKTNQLEKKVILLGYQVDMSAFMNTLDIFVLTSKWEGFGYVLAEAALAKKPIVAFDISSNPEIVKDGYNGFLVPFLNINQFAEKLALLANDSDLRTRMGLKGFQKVNQKFNFTKQLLLFEQFITL